MKEREAVTAVSNLSVAKRDLLEKYLRGGLTSSGNGRSSISRRPAGSVTPLSYGQEQIWLHSQLAPGIPLYNEPLTVHREGPLDVAALVRSFNEIIRRHEAWRTTFDIVDGQPVQVVHPSMPITIPVTDLGGLSEHERTAEALRLATEDARRPFDLARGPLVRLRLVRLGDTQHKLFVALHHIIFDGVSMYRVFLPELAALYEAFSNGRPSPLAELPIQYGDYAYWQREWLRNGALSDHMTYWRRQLGGDLPTLQLPADRPRPPVQTFRGATRPFTLPRSLTQKLTAVSQNEGVTLFMTLLAAFNVLLYRYSGQEDILIGTVTSGRSPAQLERLLGFFLNTVVLRTDVSGNPTFSELLRRVRDVTLGALSHDDVPFEHVVRELHPHRDASTSPLFQVLVAVEPQLAKIESGWNLTPIDVETGAAKFDLSLVLDDRPDGVMARLIYNTDLFDSATISRMIAHYQTLLGGVAVDPAERVSAVPLLTATERQQILVEWNSTKREYPREKCIHQIFEERVARTPDAIAVASERERLTYAALNQRANQLAHRLRPLGVRPDVPVGLCAERSLEMVVGMLGILKAGGAYLPLDPSYPPERLAFMLADAKAPVVVAQKGLEAKLPLESLQVVSLDRTWKAIAGERPEPAASEVKAQDLAYVIFTSGSSGKPKGVLITHRNLVHSTHARIQYYQEPLTGFLLLSSFAFDSSVAGIFHTLCTGGTLYLAPESFQWKLPHLVKLIAKNRISHLLALPSFYGLLLEQTETRQLSSLRAVIVAGEPCPQELVERHQQLLPQAALCNEYGPTEGTVWSSVYRCQPQGLRTLVPIGRPITNTELYALDSSLQPVPPGVAGELYIGGEGVARGYLNRDELTRERFIPNPFSEEPGARVYRTGDLARYRADGNLEFLGRLDEQVKIRGFRIELGEIEAVLLEHPVVKGAAAVATDDPEGGKRVVAYVVGKQEQPLSTDGLRSFLQSKLPEFMLPARFVRLEALPLTPNGKVDRRALPAPERSDQTPREEFSAARNPVESRLVEIWEEVLDTRPISTRQNFFDLGGHSLLVARLIRRIEQAFGTKLSMAAIFRSPTIWELAALLRGPMTRQDSPAVVPIQPEGTKPPLFWVRGGPRFRLLAQRLGADQPFLGLHLDPSDAGRLPSPLKLEDIARCLAKTMREAQPQGPYYVAGLCVSGVIAYEVASQLIAQGQQVALLVMFDSANPEYYRNFSKETRAQLLVHWLRFRLATLRRLKREELPAYVVERLKELRRKLSRRVWQISHDLGLRVDDDWVGDLDPIVHPAASSYRPRSYTGRIAFFQSTEWPAGSYWDMQASWIGVARDGFEVYRVPGRHGSMFAQPNVEIVASKLRASLCEAQDLREEGSPLAMVGI